MNLIIRKAIDKDIYLFVDFTLKLSEFNRNNHNSECKYDAYDIVRCSIQEKALKTFENRSANTIILFAELDNKPIGYVLGNILKEDNTSDNGTGDIGLLDELYVEDLARGLGIGRKLIDEVCKWMKEKEVSRIKLHAYSWNHNAKALYEKHGLKSMQFRMKSLYK